MSTSLVSKNFVRIFQRKAKIGLPSSVRPGDHLTFFLDGGAYHSREVDTVHDGYIITLPLMTRFGDKEHVLDGARKVLWEHMDSAERRIVPGDQPAPMKQPDPEPEQKPEPKKRKPKPVVPPAPVEPEPPVEPEEDLPDSALELWSLLDDG